jgi:hypothetical protein
MDAAGVLPKATDKNPRSQAVTTLGMIDIHWASFDATRCLRQHTAPDLAVTLLFNLSSRISNTNLG